MNARTAGLEFVILSLCLMLGQIPRVEAKVVEGPVETQLLEIQKKLDELKEGQEDLKKGLDQLSEEHKQLRYFTHRK